MSDTIDYQCWVAEMAALHEDGRGAWFVSTLQPAILGAAAIAFETATSAATEIVDVVERAFIYRFDILAQRAIMACGIVRVVPMEARDRARMAGHPNSQAQDYDRGHLLPHTAGGGLDINLFLQLAKVNRGPFRSLERRAIKSPGSFYSARLIYHSGNNGQVPDEIEQALFPILDIEQIEWRRFDNRVLPAL